MVMCITFICQLRSVPCLSEVGNVLHDFYYNAFLCISLSRLRNLPYSFTKLNQMTAMWLSENQVCTQPLGFHFHYGAFSASYCIPYRLISLLVGKSLFIVCMDHQGACCIDPLVSKASLQCHENMMSGREICN